MIELIEAIVLGIVQGLTEFLPVSSSGHLELVKFLVGDKASGQQSLLMTVVLHFATALATIFVFRDDIKLLLSQVFSHPRNEGHHFALKIVISMIPAALIGLLFEDLIEGLFSQRLVLVGIALMVTALLLIIADRAKRTDKNVTNFFAFTIGLAQAVAIIPGISRSGATIATAVLLRVDRDQAARFSFLMVVPLILGKIAKDFLFGDLFLVENFALLAAGFFASFITGIIACIWMLKLVRNARLRFFGWYCILVGFLSIAFGMGLFSYA